MKKKFKTSLMIGGALVEVDVSEIQLPRLRDEAIRREIELGKHRDMSFSVTAAIEDPEKTALTLEALKEAAGMVRPPAADYFVVSAISELKKKYGENLNRRSADPKTMAIDFLSGIPVKTNPVMPKNRIAAVLNGEIIAIAKINEEED